MRVLLLFVVLCIRIGASSAKSVLGFAVPGGTSHHATFAQIGLELVDRGYDFTLLLSSLDTLGQARLARPPFSNLKQVHFAGPSGVGTNEALNASDGGLSKANKLL